MKDNMEVIKILYNNKKENETKMMKKEPVYVPIASSKCFFHSVMEKLSANYQDRRF